MSRSYTSSPPSASMACRGTALLLLLVEIKVTGHSNRAYCASVTMSIVRINIATGHRLRNISVSLEHKIYSLSLTLLNEPRKRTTF
jgi:hypothetical protein